MTMPNAQASELGGTGRKSRATVKIPVLGSSPKFAFDTYTLEINQVHNLLWEYLSGRILSKMLPTTLMPFQEGEITGQNYPFSSEVAFPPSSGSKFSLISGGEKFKIWRLTIPRYGIWKLPKYCRQRGRAPIEWRWHRMFAKPWPHRYTFPCSGIFQEKLFLFILSTILGEW